MSLIFSYPYPCSSFSLQCTPSYQRHFGRHEHIPPPMFYMRFEMDLGKLPRFPAQPAVVVSRVVSGKFSKSRRRGWSWYAGDWAITGSFSEDAHHDQQEG